MKWIFLILAGIGCAIGLTIRAFLRRNREKTVARDIAEGKKMMQQYTEHPIVVSASEQIWCYIEKKCDEKKWEQDPLILFESSYIVNSKEVCGKMIRDFRYEPLTSMETRAAVAYAVAERVERVSKRNCPNLTLTVEVVPVCRFDADTALQILISCRLENSVYHPLTPW